MIDKNVKEVVKAIDRNTKAIEDLSKILKSIFATKTIPIIEQEDRKNE